MCCGHLGFRESAASDGGGGVGDQFEYLGRPGGKRGVAGVELDGFAGVDALSHPPLALRRDHSVLARDLIPARLGLPRWLPSDIVQKARSRLRAGCTTSLQNQRMPPQMPHADSRRRAEEALALRAKAYTWAE